jgi:diguanylate cyclase (GGDEF)-like protein
LKSFAELEVAQLHKELRELNFERQKLYLDTITDELTGLLNFRALKFALGQRFALLKKHKRPTGLIFVDVDRFKQVNEVHGHLVGSVVLSEIGAMIRSVLPEQVRAYRFGGDEFVLLVDGDIVAARELGEMIRSLIEEQSFRVQGFQGQTQVNVTLSLGLSMLHENESVESVIERANKAMFEAKRNSRNCLVVAA